MEIPTSEWARMVGERAVLELVLVAIWKEARTSCGATLDELQTKVDTIEQLSGDVLDELGATA